MGFGMKSVHYYLVESWGRSVRHLFSGRELILGFAYHFSPEMVAIEIMYVSQTAVHRCTDTPHIL
jgi:hypothetical protein